MKNRLAVARVAWLLITAPAASHGAVIYGVPEASGNAVGARDVNIMADDIHFATAAVINRINMRLAIKGTQTCQLWIFDGLNKAPLHTMSFTNMSAGSTDDPSTYNFDMELLVPKDIYVGFSAQGDGWLGTTNVDYWSLGTDVPVGVAGTPGRYYYGPVADGKLTAEFAPAVIAPYGCIQIWSEPVHIETVAVKTGHVHLAISALPLQITSIVERSMSAMGTNWQEVTVLALGASNQTWIATNSTATTSFYRVKSR